MRFYYTLIVGLLITCNVPGQDDSLARKGTFYGDVFLNGNYNVNKKSFAFRLNRLHFGYTYIYSKNIYFNGMIESAREDYYPQGDYNRITNLFELCLGIKFSKLEGKFGLIGTELNQMQEKLYRQRNIDKVFADKYGFAPTNDFGGILIYKPTEFITTDIATLNGEGHKMGQADSSLRYAFGITLKPFRGVYFRVYNDLLPVNSVYQLNSILVTGFQNRVFSAGVEWNKQFNRSNTRGLNIAGISVYASFDINNTWRIFGRYDIVEYDSPPDYLQDKTTEPDSQLIIAGLQYKINEQVSISINGRNQIVDQKTNSCVFLNLTLAF